MVSAGQSFNTTIYHYNVGDEIDKQQVSQDSMSKKGVIIEVEVDFKNANSSILLEF